MTRIRAALQRILARPRLWWDETDRLPAMGRALKRSKP